MVSRAILNDWQRGKLPYFIKPPNKPEEPEKKNKTIFTAKTIEDEDTDNVKQVYNR